jgi:hypothetical protein
MTRTHSILKARRRFAPEAELLEARLNLDAAGDFQMIDSGGGSGFGGGGDLGTEGSGGSVPPADISTAFAPTTTDNSSSALAPPFDNGGPATESTSTSSVTTAPPFDPSSAPTINVSGDASLSVNSDSSSSINVNMYANVAQSSPVSPTGQDFAAAFADSFAWHLNSGASNVDSSSSPYSLTEEQFAQAFAANLSLNSGTGQGSAADSSSTEPDSATSSFPGTTFPIGAVDGPSFSSGAGGQQQGNSSAHGATHAQSDLGTRVLGGLRFVGGVLQAAGGAAFGLTTAETGIGAVAGGLVAFKGLDNAWAGLRQLTSGKQTSTLTYQAVASLTHSSTAAAITDLGTDLPGAGLEARGLSTVAQKLAALGKTEATTSVSKEVQQVLSQYGLVGRGEIKGWASTYEGYDQLARRAGDLGEVAGTDALVLVKPNGEVYAHLLAQTAGTEGKSLVWEGSIGKIKLPDAAPGTTKFGNLTEAPARDLFGQVTGQKFQPHTPNAPGPDILPMEGSIHSTLGPR